MTFVIVAAAVIVVAFAIWLIARGLRREQPSAANNWHNEDHLSRSRDATWTEGSTYSKTEPRDGSGLHL